MNAEEKAALRATVRTLLPQSAVALMDEVEAYAGDHITIKQSTQHTAPDDPPNTPGLLITHERASILVPDPETINPQGIVHELLHAKRYWVDAVAQLRPSPENNTPQNNSVTAQIENAVEHLVIVPREADYGFDPHGHWNDISRARWTQYPWPDLTSAEGRRRRCFMGWLTASLVNDDDVLQVVRNGLAQEGLLVEAQKLLPRVTTFMARPQDKPRALACVARFLPIRRDALRIVYFDITNKSLRYEGMPHT